MHNTHSPEVNSIVSDMFVVLAGYAGRFAGLDNNAYDGNFDTVRSQLEVDAEESAKMLDLLQERLETEGFEIDIVAATDFYLSGAAAR